MLRRGSDQRVVAFAQDLPVEVFKGGNDTAHFAYRAFSKVPPAAVRGFSGGYDFHPDKSLVRQDELALAGLGQDAGIGRVVFDEVLCADAGILFVGDERNEQLSIDLPLGYGSGSAENRGGTALHVEGSSSVDAIALDKSIEGRNRHASHGHGVQVSTEHERRPLAVTAFANGVRPPWRGLFEPASHAMLQHPGARECGNRQFAFALGRKSRIDRRYSDELLRRFAYHRRC